MIDPTRRSEPAESTASGLATDAVLDGIEQCARTISREFEHWADPHARGPGLYFLVTDDTATEFAAPMGSNRWPTEDCPTVLDDVHAFHRTARGVAVSCDGAVVVQADGTIEEPMVRAEQLSTTDDENTANPSYADWMGARHMSALETSTRDAVIAAITLSEENGRVTMFVDGTYEGVLATPSMTD